MPGLLLASMFDALEGGGIRYCLLRGHGDLALDLPHLEIDLLLDPAHRRGFGEVATRLGLVRIPSWGHGVHRFFVAYEAARGAWIKLDVVTDLLYGRPVRRLRVDLARDCLARRRRWEATYLLQPEHELATLLLHCLLDKEAFSPGHSRRLAELRTEIRGDEKRRQWLLRFLGDLAGPSPGGERWAPAIDAGDWAAVLAGRRQITGRLTAREPVASAWRWAGATLARAARPGLAGLAARGITIALLGPDGAGKSTLAAGLSADPELRARVIYMGSNAAASTVGFRSSRWLEARRRNARTEGQPRRGGLLGALSFGNRLLEQWYRGWAAGYHRLRGRVVVFDRHPYDGLLAPPPGSRQRRLRRWILLRTAPRPALVVVLDSPGALLFERKGEHSPEKLERQRLGYLQLAESLGPRVVVVDAGQPRDAVLTQVTAIVWRAYRGGMPPAGPSRPRAMDEAGASGGRLAAGLGSRP